MFFFMCTLNVGAVLGYHSGGERTLEHLPHAVADSVLPRLHGELPEVQHHPLSSR